MKAFWKALGVAALAAAIPVRYTKDSETGRRQFQSLLLSMELGPDGDAEKTVGINLAGGVLPELTRGIVGQRREAAMFTDDPAEAAVDAEELHTMAQELEEAAGTFQAAADEVKAAAKDAQAAAEDASAADFDPEF